MKTHKKLFSLLLVLCLLLSLSITALAASYTGDDVKPGLSGIQPGDELTHPDNTDWATLTASWGVRVSFVDWDESQLKTEVVPVTDNTPGSSSAPSDPTRAGYTFTGWERHDTTNGTATLNDDGTVTAVNGPGPIVFIAKYTKNTTPPTPPADPETGNLTVSKTISGNAADSSKAFDFTVTLGDTSINGTYGDMSFSNGVATFTLKGGESKTATNLPAGTTFTVAEADYSADGYVTTKSGDTGTITDGQTATAAFTNTKNTTPPTPPVDPKFGNLTISKNVTGDLGDKTKYFTFKVEFNVDGTFSYTGSKSGTITNGGTIQLKHGESITIVDIPAGTSYTVTESGNSGYTVYASGDRGIISDGKTSTAKFTNTRSSVPKTGDNSNMPLWFSLMGISVLGMIGTLFIKTNKRRKAAHLRNK